MPLPSPLSGRLAALLTLVVAALVATLFGAGSAPAAPGNQIGQRASQGTEPAAAPSPSDTATPQRQVRVKTDVPYGDTTQPDLVLDVYARPGADGAPVVMLIHGGGWSAGDKDNFEPESRALAAADFVVFDINYSLDESEGAAYPRQVDDVQLALSWVRDHAAEYGGSPDRIGVLGGSAGGYLAAMLGTLANTTTTQPVRAVAALSGPMDIVGAAAELSSAVKPPGGPCSPRSCEQLAGVTETLQVLLGCDPTQCPPELLAEASPTTHVTTESPPFFIANSADEGVPAEQATAMADALRASGVPVELRILPGARHSVEYLSDISQELLTFLTENLVAPEPTATAATPSVPITPSDAPSAESNGGLGTYRWLAFGFGVLVLAAAVIAVSRLRRRAGAQPG